MTGRIAAKLYGVSARGSRAEARAALYKTLSVLGPHIKDAVKSQYGARSSEYALIKGVKL